VQRTSIVRKSVHGASATLASPRGRAPTLDRLAEIKNDIGAIDRTLGVLDYKGDLDAAMSRHKREVIFGRGELSRAMYGELRTTDLLIQPS
jgi:hypothetical protein